MLHGDEAAVPSGNQSRAVLPAKLLPPRPTRVIRRVRLLKLLRGRGTAPVKWLHAPAGAGKTFLLASHLSGASLRALWYEVDASDRDVSGLFAHLRRAGEHVAGSPLDLPPFQPGTPVGIDGFARRFFSQFFAQMPQCICLVFDNFHEATNEPDWNTAVRELLAARPDGATVYIASREAPPPVLARFRVSGVLELIGFDELRFDEAEIRALIRQRGGDITAVREVLRTTEGWAMAVSLLAGPLRRSPSSRPESRAARVVDGTQVVFDFLGGEILQGLDHATCTFLLQIALLPHFTATMATELSGRDDSPMLLEALQHEHLLLVRDQHGQYRLHDLLRAFLLHRGRLTQRPGDRAQLQSRAARILGEHGYFDEASSLLAEAADWAALVSLIELRAPELARQGRVATVGAAIARVPEQVRAERAWLLLWSSVAKVGRSQDARLLAERAFAAFHAANDTAGELLSLSIVLQATVLEGNDFHGLLGWLRKARESLRPGLPGAVVTRLASSELLAWAHAGHSFDDALLQRANFALELVREHGTQSDEVVALVSAAVLFFFGGAVTRAHNLIEQAEIRLSSHPAEPFTHLLYMHGTLLVRVFSTDGFRAAAAMVEEALRLASLESMSGLDTAFMVLGGTAALAVGDLKLAGKYLQQLQSELPESRMARSQLLYLRAWDACERAEWPSAQDLLAECLSEVHELGFRFAEHMLTNGSLILAARAGDGSVGAAMDAVGSIVENAPSPSLAAESMLALVYAQLCLDTCDEQSLLRALQQNRLVGTMPGGFFGPQVIERICRAALERGLEVDYCVKLLRAYEVPGNDGVLSLETWPWPVRIRVWGELEIEVDGKRVDFGRKLPAVPITLLKLMIVAGRPVPAEKLRFALWPGAAQRSQRGALDTAVYRLRKLLGRDALVVHAEGTLALEPSLCWSDVRAFEQTYSNLRSAAKAGAAMDVEQVRSRLLGLRRGPLASEGSARALVRESESLDQRWAHAQSLLHAIQPCSEV